MRLIAPLAFIAHGVGMAGGVYFVLTQKGWPVAVLGEGAAGWAARVLVALLWVVSGVAFVAAGWLLYRGDEAWRTWAWVAAPATLLGATAWAGGFPPGVWVGAAMAVAVLAYLLFA